MIAESGRRWLVHPFGMRSHLIPAVKAATRLVEVAAFATLY